MRRMLVVVLALAGCSYDWGSVDPYYLRDASADGVVTPDPRHTILPGFSCNPVSGDGCDATYCLGMVESDQTFSTLSCFPALGSGTQGTHCDGATNCVPGYICWTDPTSTQSTCEEPCFSDSDCRIGHCQTTGSYTAPYARSTLHRCI